MLLAQAEAVGGLAIGLCFLAFGAIIGTLIGAVILRAACALYNKMAGGPRSGNSVPDPNFGVAMGIVFATFLVNFGVSFVMGLVIGGIGVGAGGDPKLLQGMASLCSLPVSFFVLSGMITAMLPTSFPRAMLVALLYLVICFLVGLAILIVVFVIAMIMGFALR